MSAELETESADEAVEIAPPASRLTPRELLVSELDELDAKLRLDSLISKADARDLFRRVIDLLRQCVVLIPESK